MITLLALILLAQDTPQAPPDTGEQFFKFKVGSSWTYKATEAGKPEKKLVITVTKADGGKIFVDSREFEGEKETKVEKLIWASEDGHLVWSQERGDKVQRMFTLYKAGAKKGEQWEAGMPQMNATHEGGEEVKAGPTTFKDAIRVSFGPVDKTQPAEVTANFWMAPNVGLVKAVIQMGDKRNTLELTEYKEGK